MADNQISKFPLSELSLNSLFPIVENGVTSQTYLGKIVNNISSLIKTTDIFITGGTYNNFDGTITLTNNFGNSFNITGYSTGYTFTPENEANKQNSLGYDGNGAKYPTVDAVNNQNNLIGRISINTGFIDASDSFIMTRPDDFTLRLNPSDKGIIFKSLIQNNSIIDEAILQIPLTDIPLSGISFTGDGVYIKFVGYSDDANVVYSDTTLELANNICQLGILILKVSGGTTSFLDSIRGIINKPNISLYSNLEISLVTTQSDVIVTPNSDLTVNNTSGNLKGMSVNWHGVNNDFKPFSSNTVTSFTHLSLANALVPIPPSFTTSVTTDQYWDNSASTLVTLSTSGAATIQRWLVTINGTIALQYGEREYIDLFEASNNITIASFQDILPSSTYVEIGRMASIRDTTNLSDDTQAIFYTNGGGISSEINTSIWGEIDGSLSAQTDLNTILNNKISFVDKTFVDLGTGTNVTDIYLSARTNLITTITGSTLLNFIPELSGSGKENFLIIDGHFPNFFSGVTYSNNTIWVDNRPLVINNLFYNIGIDFKSTNNTVNAIVRQLDDKILIGGAFTTYSGISANRIIRLNTDGSVDNTFNVGTGFNSSVQTIVIQTGDSKILIGGDFTQFNSGITQNRLIRLNSDGSPDLTFNIGTGFNNTVQSIAIQSGDSKILVGGNFIQYSGVTANRLIRLNTGGTVDDTFNVNSGFNATVKAIIVQPDNKIICCGFFNSFNSLYQGYLIRLNTDGSKDNTFPISSGLNNQVHTIKLLSTNQILIGGDFTGYKSFSQSYISKVQSNGQLNANFNIGNGFNSTTYKVLLLPDSKILVGGSFTSYKSSGANNLIKLNPDGNVDTSLNTVGIGGFNGQVFALALQSGDSRIVAGGSFSSYSGLPTNKIIRLFSGGTIDTSFYNGGVGGSSNPSISSIEVPSGDTKILVGGNFTNFATTLSGRIIKLNQNGTIDTGFSGTGAGFNYTVNSTATQSDGKIVLGGGFTFFNGSVANNIIRLNTDGTRDITFNSGVGFNSSVYTVAIQSDNKILCGGSFSLYSGQATNYLVRLNEDGTKDTSFNIGNALNSSVQTIAIQSDNKIIIGGNFSTFSGQSVNYLMRLNADGTKDTSFITGPNFSSSVIIVAIQSDQKILVGGNFSTFSGQSQNYFIRLNTDGTKDTSFNIGTAFNNGVTTIAIQSGDSKILVGGYFTQFTGQTNNYLIRLNTDGTKDATFSVGTSFDTYIYGLAIDNNNKIVVAGNFITYQGGLANRIIRLNTDGTRDTSFSAGTGFDNNTTTVVFSNDGYLVSGNYLTYNPMTINRLMRLNSDGTLDNTFSTTSGFNNTVNITYTLPDGKILVGGDFTTYSGVTANRIIRLNPNGMKDVTFSGGGTGFNNGVSAIYPQLDGKILIGGSFTTYNGSNAGGIVRINPNGSRDFTLSSTTGFVGGNNQVTSIFQQTGTSSIVVGGWFTSYSGVNAGNLIRLTSGGTIDTTFNNDTGYYPNNISSMALLPDNDFIIVGGFTQFSGYSAGRFLRLNPDGNIDNTLNIGTGFNATVQSIELLSDNKLLIGGNFTLYKNIPINRLTIIDYSGTPDFSLTIGSGFNNTIVTTLNNTTTSATTSYLIGGGFTIYNNTTSNFFMNLTTRLDKKYYIKSIQDDNIILKNL